MRVTKWLRCIQLVDSNKNCKHEKSIQHIAKKTKQASIREKSGILRVKLHELN